MAEVRPRLNGPRKRESDLQTIFSTRMRGDVKEQIENWIHENGLTKRQASEFAFELAMEKFPHLEPR